MELLRVLERAIEERRDLQYGNLFYSEELGINVDKYNDIAVVQWWNRQLEKLAKEIFDLLHSYFPHVIEKNDLKKRVKAGLKRRKRIVRGYKHRTIIQEGKFKFFVDCLHGQRTGFYLDQVENHLRVEELLEYSERTLDLFSYTGPFGIHASIYSSKVICVDKSLYAVKEGYNNVRLNKLPHVDFVHQDALDYLYNVYKQEKFDLAIVDPPEYIKLEYLASVLRLACKLSKTVVFINRLRLRVKQREGLIVWY
ncbi:MAG: hypothetical protein GXO42_01980 [bacterium]|nr:hypothetical protein [bacterium]